MLKSPHFPSFRLSKLVAATILFSLLALSSPVMASVLRADISGDGRVDLDDYSLLVQNWGKTGDLAQAQPSPQNTFTPVPSPIPTTSPVPPPPASASPIAIASPGVTPSPVIHPTPLASPAPSPSSIPSYINISDPSLVAYFSLDETSGAFNNQKPNSSAANLITQGTVQYGQSGKVGKSLRVSGKDHALCSNGGTGTSCKDAPPYDFADNFSISFWANFDSTDAETLNILVRKWERGSPDPKGAYVFSIFGQKFYSSLSHDWPDWLYGYDQAFLKVPKGRSFREATGKVSPSTWNHIVIVRDATKPTYEVYLNGKMLPSKNGITTQANGTKVVSVMKKQNMDSADPFRIGEFQGLLDEVVIYKKVLSAQEVTKLYTMK